MKTVRLNEASFEQLESMRRSWGVSRTTVLERALEEMARTERLEREIDSLKDKVAEHDEQAVMDMIDEAVRDVRAQRAKRKAAGTA